MDTTKLMLAASRGQWATAYLLYQAGGLEESGYGESGALEDAIAAYDQSAPVDVAVVCTEMVGEIDRADEAEVLGLLAGAANEAAYRTAKAALESLAVASGPYAVATYGRGDMACLSAGLQFPTEQTATAYRAIVSRGDDGTEGSYTRVVKTED